MQLTKNVLIKKIIQRYPLLFKSVYFWGGIFSVFILIILLVFSLISFRQPKKATKTKAAVSAGFTRKCITCNWRAENYNVCPDYCDFCLGGTSFPCPSPNIPHPNLGYGIDSVVTSAGEVYFSMLGDEQESSYYPWGNSCSSTLNTYENLFIGKNTSAGYTPENIIKHNLGDTFENLRIDQALMVTESSGIVNKIYTLRPKGEGSPLYRKLKLFEHNYDGTGLTEKADLGVEAIRGKETIDAVYNPALDFGAFVYGHLENNNETLRAIVYDQGQWYGITTGGLLIHDLAEGTLPIDDPANTCWLSNAVISATIAQKLDSTPRLVVSLGYTGNPQDSQGNDDPKKVVRLYAADWNRTTHTFTPLAHSGLTWQDAIGYTTPRVYAVSTSTFSAIPSDVVVAVARHDPSTDRDLIELYRSNFLYNYNDLNSVTWGLRGTSLKAGDRFTDTTPTKGCVQNLVAAPVLTTNASPYHWSDWIMWAYLPRGCDYGGDDRDNNDGSPLKSLYQVHVARYNQATNSWVRIINNQPIGEQESEWDCDLLGCHTWTQNNFWLSLNSWPYDPYESDATNQTQVFVVRRFKRAGGVGGIIDEKLDFTANKLYQVNNECLIASEEGTTPPESCQLLPSPSASPSRSPSPTPTPTPTRSPSPSPTRSPSPTPTKSPTPTPTKSPTPSPTKSPTPIPTRSPSPSPTKSPTPTPTPLPPKLSGQATCSSGLLSYYLSWTSTYGATSYTLQRCAGVNCTNFATLTTISRTYYNDYSYNPRYDTYRYRVRAYNKNTNWYSSWSNIITLIAIYCPR